jgi:hypothetical protein
MLFNAIEAGKLTQDQAVTKYWGGTIESTPHPKYRYGCDAHPHGWTEITQEEFAQSDFFRYSPYATGWSRTLLGDARMFFLPRDVGYALIGDYWEKTVRIFKFGCQHESTSKEVGRCLTEYTCKKCGYVEVIDSSD